MSYESNYPFITGTLNGTKQDTGKSEEEYANQYNELQNQLDGLKEEKKSLEERRDALKAKKGSQIGSEEEIRDTLFRTYMNAAWNAYKGMENNRTMGENMRKKEEAYEHEYSQLMDEIANLTKDKGDTYPVSNKE